MFDLNKLLAFKLSPVTFVKSSNLEGSMYRYYHSTVHVHEFLGWETDKTICTWNHILELHLTSLACYSVISSQERLTSKTIKRYDYQYKQIH